MILRLQACLHQIRTSSSLLKTTSYRESASRIFVIQSTINNTSGERERERESGVDQKQVRVGSRGSVPRATYGIAQLKIGVQATLAFPRPRIVFVFFVTGGIQDLANSCRCHPKPRGRCKKNESRTVSRINSITPLN
jgi:hypothetical protein